MSHLPFAVHEHCPRVHEAHCTQNRAQGRRVSRAVKPSTAERAVHMRGREGGYLACAGAQEARARTAESS